MPDWLSAFFDGGMPTDYPKTKEEIEQVLAANGIERNSEKSTDYSKAKRLLCAPFPVQTVPEDWLYDLYIKTILDYLHY